MTVRRAATADAERLGEIHLHRGDNIRLWRDSLPRVLSRLDEHELVPRSLASSGSRNSF